MILLTLLSSRRRRRRRRRVAAVVVVGVTTEPAAACCVRQFRNYDYVVIYYSTVQVLYILVYQVYQYNTGTTRRRRAGGSVQPTHKQCIRRND